MYTLVSTIFWYKQIHNDVGFQKAIFQIFAWIYIWLI